MTKQVLTDAQIAAHWRIALGFDDGLQEVNEGDLQYGSRAIESAVLSALAAQGEAQPVAACQACGLPATKRIPDEATDLPGPYCEECWPTRPAAPSAVGAPCAGVLR